MNWETFYLEMRAEIFNRIIGLYEIGHFVVDTVEQAGGANKQCNFTFGSMRVELILWNREKEALIITVRSRSGKFDATYKPMAKKSEIERVSVSIFGGR